MFSNDYKYVGSVFEFNPTERRFTEPFSLKPQRTWNGKNPSPYKIIKSTKKSSASNNVFFEGRFIFNEGYTVGIQSRSINFIIENHSSLVGDKYEYMDITPESLLYAISFNDDSCSNTVDILEKKFHGLNIPLVFFDEKQTTFFRDYC